MLLFGCPTIDGLRNRNISFKLSHEIENMSLFFHHFERLMLTDVPIRNAAL